MSFNIGDKVEAKCLHCETWHNWEVRTIKDDGSVGINRIGDGEECGCARQLVKAESVRMSRLAHREAVNSLAVGALVKAPALWDKETGYHGGLAEYTVMSVCASVDVTQPCYMVRVVCERTDEAGKRHSHFFHHNHLELV